MSEMVFEIFDEIFERVRLHGAVHKKDVEGIVIKPECVLFDYLDIRKTRRPAACDISHLWIDLNAGYLTWCILAQKIRYDPSLAATDVDKRIFRSRIEIRQHDFKSCIRSRLASRRSMGFGKRRRNKDAKFLAADLYILPDILPAGDPVR